MRFDRLMRERIPLDLLPRNIRGAFTMKRFGLPRSIALAVFLNGCAGMTGVFNWEGNKFQSNLDRSSSFKCASQAVAKLGRVTFADEGSGSISGDCGEGMDVAVTVYEEAGKVKVTLKSRFNKETTQRFAMDTGERQGCFDRVIQQMNLLGCTLTSVTSDTAVKSTH